MVDEFDLCGIHIPLDDIKDYRVVHREYIYRPAYKEREMGLKKLMGSKYEFAEMVPFASILTKDDREYKLATESYKAGSMRDSVIKDIAVEAFTTITTRANRKRFRCKNIAGRMFTIYLDDVPASIVRLDGKISDVYKHDELYSQLGEPIAPTVITVPALWITTPKEDFIFYGNNIQIVNMEQTYIYLRQLMDAHKTEKAAQKTVEKKIEMPQIPEKVKNLLELPSKALDRQRNGNG